jgi:hypothetical protein
MHINTVNFLTEAANAYKNSECGEYKSQCLKILLNDAYKQSPVASCFIKVSKKNLYDMLNLYIFAQMKKVILNNGWWHAVM